MDGIQLNITTSKSLKRKSSNEARSGNAKATRQEISSSTVPDSKPKENVLQANTNSAKPFDSQSALASYPYRPRETMSIAPILDEGVIKEAASETLFSVDSFQDLPFHPHLVKNITEKLGFSKMTLVQKLGIPTVMKGVDTMIKSQTGSGKTMVYALPILNALGTMDPPVSRNDGVYCIVILPTRELAVQSFEVFHNLCRAFIKVTPGCLSGGEKKKSEKARIRKGINILVSTPGRLLDHLKTSANLSSALARMKYLVVDEADRLLEAGFEQQIGEILHIIKQGMGDNPLQTILLSATLTPAVERLVSLSLKNPEFIDIQALSSSGHHGSDNYAAEPTLAIPDKLKQYYAVTPTKLKLAALTTFLLRIRKHKVVIFLPTQDVVEYLYSLYENVFDQLVHKVTPPNQPLDLSEKIKLFRLHGEMGQSERSDVFKRFSQAECGFLFSTDVAARGLDLPGISWVAQFQAPETPAVYVHRVGRTARAGRSGSSLLFLIPNENQYVKMMREDLAIKLKSIRFSSVTAALEGRDPNSKGDELRLVFEVQHAIDEVVANDKKLHEMARKGYISFVRAYATYRNDQRRIFNVRNGLHFGHIARAFGLKDESPTEINNILRRYNPAQKRQFNPRTSFEHNSYHNNDQPGNDASANPPAPADSGSYPAWRGSTFSKQSSGAVIDTRQPMSSGRDKPRSGTKVINGIRAGGRSGYQVAMTRCSEFASGL